MSFEYIRKTYGVDCKRGKKIKYKNMIGEIRSSHNQYLKVKFPDQKRLYLLHPTWEIEYLN